MIINPKFTYLLLMVGTLILPLVLSFDKKVHFFKRWKYLFPAILIPAVIFIVWDIIFTEQGIWHFSDEYTLGVKLLSLPLEEWLFFFAVPYACLFVYDVIKYYLPDLNDIFRSRWLTMLLMLASLITVFIFIDRTYTWVVAVFLFGILIIQFFTDSSDRYLFRFFLAYAVCLMPFALVNGLLTALPVVIYNDMENTGFRIVTIPVEDLVYFMTLFLMNVTLYEFLLRESTRKNSGAIETVGGRKAAG